MSAVLQRFWSPPFWGGMATAVAASTLALLTAPQEVFLYLLMTIAGIGIFVAYFLGVALYVGGGITEQPPSKEPFRPYGNDGLIFLWIYRLATLVLSPRLARRIGAYFLGLGAGSVIGPTLAFALALVLTG